jgi:hypothetical protein
MSLIKFFHLQSPIEEMSRGNLDPVKLAATNSSYLQGWNLLALVTLFLLYFVD